MPKAEVRARGGSVRVRSKRLPNGDVLTCHVVRRPGPRGGHTVCVVTKRKGGQHAT